MSLTDSFDFEDIKARFPNRFGYCLRQKRLTISQAIGRKDEIGSGCPFPNTLPTPPATQTITFAPAAQGKIISSRQ